MAAPASAYLVAELDDGFGDVYPLHRGVTYGVGRSPKNRVVLADDLSSRDHAELAFAEGEWYVRDLGSTNGTKVNGRVVRGDQALASGDKVQFGSTRFRFVGDLADLPGIPEAPARALEDAIRITRRTTKTKFLPGDRGGRSADETVAEPATGPRRWPPSTGWPWTWGRPGPSRTWPRPSWPACSTACPPSTGPSWPWPTPATWTWSPTAAATARPRPTTRRRSSSAARCSTAARPSWPRTCRPTREYSARDSIRELKAASLICAPVLFGDKVLGLIHLYCTTRARRSTPTTWSSPSPSPGSSAGAVTSSASQDVADRTRTARCKDQLRVESELVGDEPRRSSRSRTQIGRVAEHRRRRC